MYQELMSQYYINLNNILTQRCSALNVNVNVSFVRSMPFLIEENLLKVRNKIIRTFLKYRHFVLFLIPHI